MYFSKKLDDSLQFYYEFLNYDSSHSYGKFVDYRLNVFPVEILPIYMQKRYEDKINALSQDPESIYRGIRSSDLEFTAEDQAEILNLIFCEHVDRYFNDGIYFYDELKLIILDKDNKIRNFDELIFQILRYYAAKFNIIDIEAVIAVCEHERKIQEGAYSKGVKKLTEANMHESKVKFEINKPYITAHFGSALYHSPLHCRFHAVFDTNLRIFDCEIIGSEVLINDNGTFQYNALVYPRGLGQGSDEIKITFHDVEVKELQEEQEDFEEGGNEG